MATRPLRQYYDEPIGVTVAEDVGSVLEPWLRHRRRFVTSLTELTDAQWQAPSRCDGWTVQEVVSHLVTADGFWIASLDGAKRREPTAFLTGFDPSAAPDAIIAPMRALAPAQVLEQFRDVTDRFLATVTDLDDDDWAATAESPVGHVTARLALAHAAWDSWLHERDIFVALGIDVPVETDELLLATWYTLALGAVQGGLRDDPAPVGPGLEAALDVELRFADLPDDPLHLVIDRTVSLSRGTDAAGTGATGRALAAVEWVTGRGSDGDGDALPQPLADHLARAREIL